MTTHKPGLFTTEFYVTIAVMLCALALGLTGKIDGNDAMFAITGAGGAYSVSRGLAKRSS